MKISQDAGSAGLPPNLPSNLNSPAKIKDAAEQFEGFVITQILKSTHDGNKSWLGTGDDDAGGSAVDMAEQAFAKALSHSGGLGLARFVEAELEGPTQKRPAHGTPTRAPQKLTE